VLALSPVSERKPQLHNCFDNGFLAGRTDKTSKESAPLCASCQAGLCDVQKVGTVLHKAQLPDTLISFSQMALMGEAKQQFQFGKKELLARSLIQSNEAGASGTDGIMHEPLCMSAGTALHCCL
jgi:hypothetical protein